MENLVPKKHLLGKINTAINKRKIVWWYMKDRKTWNINKYRNRKFWCRRYYVDTASKNDRKIQEYIQKQLKENQLEKQLTSDTTSLQVANNNIFACIKRITPRYS